ncbi:MAG: hypothetical protein COA79_19210 [Planctomycetota bacterium]|nr:MAG: hypothetical protein COA79_19210 [Planctomycetota bacterium]
MKINKLKIKQRWEHALGDRIDDVRCTEVWNLEWTDEGIYVCGRWDDQAYIQPGPATLECWLFSPMGKKYYTEVLDFNESSKPTSKLEKNGWVCDLTKKNGSKSVHQDEMRKLPLKNKAPDTSADLTSPDNKMVIEFTSDNEAFHIQEKKTGKEICHIDYSPMNLKFSPDGTLLATESLMDHTIRIWDTKSGEELARKSLGEQHVGIGLFVWSPSGDALAGVRMVRNILTVWEISQ